MRGAAGPLGDERYVVVVVVANDPFVAAKRVRGDRLHSVHTSQRALAFGRALAA